MPDAAPNATGPLGPDGFPLNPISAGTAAPVAEAALAPAPAPAAPPVTRFLNDRSRVKTVALEWPVEVDGVAYREVVIRRLTAGEVGAFVDRVRASGSTTEITRSLATLRAICHRPSVPSEPSIGSTS